MFCGHRPLWRGERHCALVKQKPGFVTWSLLVSGEFLLCYEGDRRFNIEQGVNFQNKVSIPVGHEDMVVKLSQLLDTWG